MSLPNQNIQALVDTKMRVWNEARTFLETCETEKRSFNEEEKAQWERYNVRIDELDSIINDIVSREQRAQVDGVSREALERQVGSIEAKRIDNATSRDLNVWARTSKPGDTYEIDLTHAAKEVDMIRRGATEADIREYRALAWDTGSIASGVPTTTARELYQLMTAPIAMFNLPTRKFFTGSGEQMKFPRINAHAIATQVSGQGTTLAGTDPTFLSMTLDAFKYGELVKVANEVLTDTVFDVASFLGQDIARALGQKIDTDLTVGSGSGAPMGVMTAVLVGSNGTIATGGSLITPTYENLVDLVYSVNNNYRSGGNAAFLMRDLTASVVRKIRDGSGGTLGAAMWQPSQTVGIQGAEPGLLLGYPVYTDPNIASCASNAKIVAFGDWSAYYLRQVGPLVIERDESRYFDTDEVGFRGKWRVDGDVIDLTALNLLKQSV